MTVCFVGGFGRNAHRAIQIPENWKAVLLDSITDLPNEPFILVAGLGSRLAESIISSTKGYCSHYILVKPFAFEHKEDIADRCLGMIPADCKTYVFDNQKMADEDSKQGLGEFQKSLFAKIESILDEVESKLQNLTVL